MYVLINDDVRCIIPTSNRFIKKAAIQLAQKGIRVNGFRNPGGRDYGYGYFIICRDDVEALKTSTSISVTIHDDSSKSVKADNEEDLTSTIVIDNLILTETKDLIPGGEGGGDAVLIKLADYRFIFSQNKQRHDFDPFPPHEQFSSNQIFASSNIEGIRSYWNLTNILYTTLNTDYVDMPDILLRDIQTPNTGSSWDQMNDILDLTSHTIYKTNSGFSILPNYLQGIFNDSLAESYSDRKMGFRNENAAKLSFLPRKVNVRFRQLDSDFFNQTLSFVKYYPGTDTTIPCLGRDIHVYNIFDPSHSNNAAYETQLNNLADDLSTLFFDSYDNHNLRNAVYFGAIPFEPGPDAHCIEYYHDPIDDKYKTVVTSIDLRNHQFPDFDRQLELYYNQDFSTTTSEEPSIADPQNEVDQPAQLCLGSCKYTWDSSTETWTLDSDDCEANTTTTTTTSTTTSDPSDCPSFENTLNRPPTTAPPTCVCVPPQFCGTIDNQCHYTDCVSDEFEVPEEVECDSTSTTTTIAPGDCTTTLPPECDLTDPCKWWYGPYGWIKIEDDCILNNAESCRCEEPTVNAEFCDTTYSPCITRVTDEPDPSCTGSCTWIGNVENGKWYIIRTRSDCNGIAVSCNCSYPSRSVSGDCEYTTTQCLPPDGETTTIDPCNTTTPDPCNDACRWAVVGAGPYSWAKASDPCPADCPCIEPGYAVQDETCEVAWTPCDRNNPTTTTTSTTTSTTTPAPTGACCQKGAIAGETECDDDITENGCIVLGGIWWPGQTCASVACESTYIFCCNETNGFCYGSTQVNCPGTQIEVDDCDECVATTTTTTTTSTTTAAPRGPCCSGPVPLGPFTCIDNTLESLCNGPDDRWFASGTCPNVCL